MPKLYITLVEEREIELPNIPEETDEMTDAELDQIEDKWMQWHDKLSDKLREEFGERLMDYYVF